MVVFGGRSGEHEVSLASARAVMEALQSTGQYEIQPVGITREGRWLSGGDPMTDLTRQLDPGSGGSHGKTAVSGGEQGSLAHAPALSPAGERLPSRLDEADVVFPVLHGPRGEDGTVQGMLELAGIPYVGSGVLASAVGMDKVTMKKVFAYHGLAQVEWLDFTGLDWDRNRRLISHRVSREIGYPCFVKPSNMGSSVGISKVDVEDDLAGAVESAAAFDRRIIVEAGLDAREIEVSVLGNEEPEVSLPGEIVIGSGGFYDYENKYTEGASEIVAPADLPEDLVEEVRRTARSAYRAVDAAGMARIDFFLERETNRLLLNEINTIPGFTPTSVYSRLWEKSGLPYEDLLQRLIQLALERHG